MISRKRSLVLLISLASLYSAPSLARQELSRSGRTPNRTQASCQNVDRRDASLGTPRDQGTRGWCVAYATADLLSQRFHRKVSASDLAFSYATNLNVFDRLSRKISGNDVNDGAFLLPMLQLALENGVCPEEEMPSDPLATEVSFAILHLDQDPLRQMLTDAYRNASWMQPGLSCDKIAFPGLFGASFQDLLQVLTSGKKDLFPDLQKISCRRDHSVTENLRAVRRDARVKSPQGTSVIDEIDRQLDAGNILAIAYDNSFLMKSGRGGSHASTIVARRWNGKECQYLIRGTWGPICKPFSSAVECDTNDPGNTWASEKDLQKSLYSISYLASDSP